MAMAMSDELKPYTGTELFQVLIRQSEALSVLDDWIERNIQSDLRIRRAKTAGCVVIETKDVIFARNICVWHPDAKINIVK